MLRIEVSEAGQGALPAIDVDDAVVVIGSAPDARVRLPAEAAQAEHVRIAGGRWTALGPVRVDGVARDGGEIGDGITLEIGRYRLRVELAPAGAVATPPQRTESLARELMRSLLGSGAAPSFEVERGPIVGVKQQLQPPESVLVIGRGDEASWILLDEDLSRAHVEVRRSWDGIRIVDLGSKNGTRLDGTLVGPDGVLLHDGALVELGKVGLRFRDPAEKHLRAAPVTQAATPSAKRAPVVTSPVVSAPPAAPPRASTVPFYAAVTVMAAALVGVVWILSR